MRIALVAFVVLAVTLLAAPRAGAEELPAGCSPLTALDPDRRAELEAICPPFPSELGFDPPECALLALGSPLDLLTQGFEVPPEDRKSIPTIAAALANALSGNNGLSVTVLTTVAGVAPATVALNADACDLLLSNGDGTCGAAPAPAAHAGFAAAGATLNEVLTDEQEALLGCGPLYGGDCEASGVDPFAADLPALTQSWVGFDGTCVQQSGFEDWHLANGEPQPGTIGHPGAAALDVAGARSPFLADGTTPNPAYTPSVDGSIADLAIPAEFGASAGQPFASEMAALSFNLQLLLVALSAPTDGPPALDQLDPNRPYAFYDPAEPETVEDRGRCSYAQPQHCRVMRAIVVPEADGALAAAASAMALGVLAARGRRERGRSRR